jgi:hypothetical protein
MTELLWNVSMTPFHYLPANQTSLFSLVRPTKKPDTTFIGRSFRVIKTSPKMYTLILNIIKEQSDKSVSHYP